MLWVVPEGVCSVLELDRMPVDVDDASDESAGLSMRVGA